MKERPVGHRVLGIGREGGFLSELDPLLESCNTELYLAPSPRMGLEIIRSLGPVDLVIIEYPLEGFSMAGFRTEIKGASADQTRLAVLGRRPDLESIAGSEGLELVLLPFERSVEEVGETLWKLLDRAPRIPVQVMVRLELTSAQQRILRLAQTENISKTGMLLHTREKLPQDASVDFEFFIPEDDSHPIRGAASVVRSIASDDGSPLGVAIRFESLLGSDQLRLESFLSNATVAA